MVPDVDVVKCWALEHGIKGTFSALCENELVKKMILDDMLQWGKTAGLKTFEQVSVWYIISLGLTILSWCSTLGQNFLMTLYRLSLYYSSKDSKDKYHYK